MSNLYILEINPLSVASFRAVPLMRGDKEGVLSKNFRQFSKASRALDPRRCGFSFSKLNEHGDLEMTSGWSS